MYKKEEVLNNFYKKVASQVKFKKAGDDDLKDPFTNDNIIEGSIILSRVKK